MKTLQQTLRHSWFAGILMSCFIFMSNPCSADDSCIFAVTPSDVPPNIVMLLDNGAEMEQIMWLDGFDNSVDYTPAAGTEFVNGFFNDNGYTVDKVATGKYYIRPILPDLTPDPEDANASPLFATNTFTINTREITLPYAPSTVAVDSVIDNANMFRYTKNYLNWIFFDSYVDVSSVDDGTDLPAKTRFYHAKKAIFTVAKLTLNQAKFGIYNFANDAGASSVQSLKFVVDEPIAEPPVLDSAFVNTINNMGTVTYSPLAEGLSTVGYYYSSPSSGIDPPPDPVDEYCQGQYAIIVTPGVSSQDQGTTSKHVPASLADYDEDNATGGIGEGNIKIDSTTSPIPINLNGSTYLDDVAHYLRTNDVVGYVDGFQNVSTFTVGFMAGQLSNAFLINTSNNGNGNLNLYDTSNPEYGKYHFEAEDPEALAEALEEAVESIIKKTNTFTAPVVPVTRTTSGDRIYLSFFKPNEGNFWEGSVTKFGLSTCAQILNQGCDSSCRLSDDACLATYPNGAMKDETNPYWTTKDWKDIAGFYSSRNIYTYLGTSTSLTTDASNYFLTTNAGLTDAVMGSPTHTTAEIIDYVRGKDVFDEDVDTVYAENRAIICGDALHGEPLVIRYNDTTTMVYYGANDGMLHAVNDSDGSEAWAFIPPDQLHRLKDIVEGTGHQYFVDSGPKAYLKDVDDDGNIESGEGDRVILICGERGGGTSYFALDVTDPTAPVFLWRINQVDDSTTYGIPAPDAVIAELGDSWSVPVVGRVKTTAAPEDGVDVFFIGGGHSADNSEGNAVLAINVLTGTIVRQFRELAGGSEVTACPDMIYSIPSAVNAVDEDGNGFVDKVYVGDLGGQMWRFGKFPAEGFDDPYNPTCDENIDNWEAHILFCAGCGEGESNCANSLDDNANGLIDEWRQFFYPPTVTLEIGYDLVFMGTGDRENPCETISSDRFYCIKDTHSSTTVTELVVNAATTTPDLNGLDNGWYIELAVGEKVLAENTVFNKVAYFTTFTPNNDACVPGGYAKLYGLNYLTGETVVDFGVIGGGIPSKPVIIITDTHQQILVSVGSTNPEGGSGSSAAGIVGGNPPPTGMNLFIKWWKELFN